MARIKDADFFVLVPSGDGKTVELAYGRFAEGCENLYGDELKRRVKKGYEFCAHVLVPHTNMFQRFNEEGGLEDFLQDGLYWASVWQDRRARKTVVGHLDAPILRSDCLYKMIETGYLGMSTGFNFSRVTCVSGMNWHTGLHLAKNQEEEKRYVWMVTIDGSSHGDYENAANSCLFGSFDEARKFVTSSLTDDVVNACFQGVNQTDEALEKEISEHCKWFGEDQAQFRICGAVTDYKIEKTAVPERSEA